MMRIWGLLHPRARLLKETLDLRMMEMEQRVLKGITLREIQIPRSCFPLSRR
ncbi:MAG: hypothetical protein ACLR0U_11230 [Enterocloster clostridioformis]